MAKAKRRKRKPASYLPSGSRVRPGLRRTLDQLLHSGRVAAAVLAALAGTAMYAVLTSPRYAVQTVEAEGVQALSSMDVEALAAVDGQPIWFVEADEIAARVAQSPYVERAKARLVLPDRVQVTVLERKPEVRWLHNGVAYAVTWDGRVVDQVQPAAAEPLTLTTTDTLSATAPLTAADPLSATLPVSPAEPPLEALPPAELAPAANEGGQPFVSTLTIVDTTPNRPLRVGDFVDADAIELARRVALRAPTELPMPLTRIEWDGGLGVSLIVGDGRQVVLGRSDELDRKLATLRYLLNDNTPFTFLDLRPTTPYYR